MVPDRTGADPEDETSRDSASFLSDIEHPLDPLLAIALSLDAIGTTIEVRGATEDEIHASVWERDSVRIRLRKHHFSAFP